MSERDCCPRCDREWAYGCSCTSQELERYWSERALLADATTAALQAERDAAIEVLELLEIRFRDAEASFKRGAEQEHIPQNEFHHKGRQVSYGHCADAVRDARATLSTPTPIEG